MCAKPVSSMTNDELLAELTKPVVWTLDAGRLLCADGAPMFILSAPPSRYVSPTALDDMARRVCALLNVESES